MNPQQAAQHVLNTHWDRRIPVRLDRLAERIGARTVVRGGSLDAGFECKGRVSWGGIIPLVELNAYEPPLTRRVIAAHQLGHLAMGHHHSAPDTAASFEAIAADPRDRDANHFAALVLMPEVELRDAYATGVSVEQLAQDFEVPLPAMVARLQGLNLPV